MNKLLFAIGLGLISTQGMNAQNQETTITILQTADLHAYLNPHRELFVENEQIQFRDAGGVAHIKTYVDQVRAENPHGTLLVDGGDFIQGSGESVLSQGQIFPPIANALAYDLMIPGNWEVIYGKETMLNVMNQYQTQVIASNMFHQADRTDLFPPYWVTEKKGLKIGFIAYNDPEIPIRQNPLFSEGIHFTQVEENLKSLVQFMRKKQKVDVLFLVAHIGISKQIVLANHPAVKGVDYILGNDTHERIRQPIQGQYAQVLEPGSFGSFVGRLDLTFKNKKLKKSHYELVEINPEIHPAHLPTQQLVDSLTAPYRDEMNEVIGYTKTPLYRYLVIENSMDNFITDALLWKSGADIAISNGFRFGVPIVPEQDSLQPITREDLWRMIPVDEHMKIGEVTGQQIWNWLEKELNNVFSEHAPERFGGWLVRFAGMRISFDSSKKQGERLITVNIQGEPIDLSKTYRLASCNRTGEPLNVLCRLPNAKNVEIMPYTLHEAIVEYLADKKVIAPKVEGRAKAIDLKPNYFSEIPAVNYQFR